VINNKVIIPYVPETLIELRKKGKEDASQYYAVRLYKEQSFVDTFYISNESLLDIDKLIIECKGFELVNKLK
jgi:hypothetical protein